MELLSRDRTICGGLFAAQRVQNRRLSKPNTVVIRRAGYGALDRLDRVRRVRLLRLTCRAADGPAQPEMTLSGPEPSGHALPAGWFGIFTFSPLIKATQDTGPRLVAFIRGTVEAGSSLAFSALRCRAFRERFRTGRVALPFPQR